MTPKLLIVEDEEGLREELAEVLSDQTEVRSCASVGEAMGVATAWRPSVILLDYRLPDGTARDLLPALRQELPDAAIMVMTAFPDVKTAVEIMKLGAYDYVIKPFELDQLRHTLTRAVEASMLRREVTYLRRQVRNSMDRIIGESESIRRVLAEVDRVAPSPDTPVLITGESGTGKELVANYLHHKSPRVRAPLVKVNVGGLPSTLIESELFGHEKGAFTGATHHKKGLVEEADGGTLFLDEISEMNPELQPKLLRFAETGTFFKVGGTRESSVNERILSATNRDPHDLIGRGLFRSDLYYRLAVVQIRLPSLRERGDDIVRIAEAYLACFATGLRKPLPKLSAETRSILLKYPWPGNIRELRNVMERAVLYAKSDVIGPDVLPDEIRSALLRGAPAKGTLQEAERTRIREVLESTAYNKSQTARILGISRVALRAKMRRLGIQPAEPPNRKDSFQAERI